MSWSSSALPKLSSYSLKSFPVSIEATIEHILYPRLCDIQPEFEILFAHRFVTSWLVTSPTARTWLAEKCLLSGTWKQVVVYTGAVPDLSEYCLQTRRILWHHKCQFINSFTLLSQQNLVTCELKWGGSFTESNILIHVDRQRSNVCSLNSFILPIFISEKWKRGAMSTAGPSNGAPAAQLLTKSAALLNPRFKPVGREMQLFI